MAQVEPRAQSDTDTDYFGQSSADFQRLTDAILIVEEQQLPVHKAVIAANSATFAKLFESCPTEACSVLPLDDSLHDVCTSLKFLYDGCTALKAVKLRSVEDAYCVSNFAHKYDMKALLEECEAYLVQARRTKLFSQPGAIVRWTLLAEKCEMGTLLAHCELFMATRIDESFWTDLTENAMQLSSDSLLRMLKVATCKNRGVYTDVEQMKRWQQPSQAVGKQ